MPRSDAPFEERLRSRYQPDPATGCWLWSGGVSPAGYGQISKNNRTMPAHRAVWELHREPIPQGLTIDHLCGVRLCVNPDHPEVVTYSENNYRRFRPRPPLPGT